MAAKTFTNMYKDPNFSDQNLNNALAILAVGDIRHDFGFPIDERGNVNTTDKISSGNLRSDKIFTAINYGLPIGGGYNTAEIYDEPGCLNSVIASYTIDGNPRNDFYRPITVANPGYETNKTSTHTITTKNGNKFTVNYADVKPHNKFIPNLIGEVVTKEISASDFYKKLGLADRITGIVEAKFSNIAIIVDATSVGFYEILQTGSWDAGVRPTVHYIYGAEVVNDPATKKPPDSKIFKSSSKGVNLISCLPYITNPTNAYNYNFRPKSPKIETPYLNQFYTKFNFELSDIKTITKGKSIEYITNLNITGDQGELNPVVDSKTKNDITYLDSHLKILLTKFGTLTPTLNEKFLFSSMLQQKRSGDWLQVLLCAAVKDKIRQFKNKDDQFPNNDLGSVFFVTHDQIALSYALLNGINCFFTHHDSSNHFHSVFSYILTDEAMEARENIVLARQFKSETVRNQLKKDATTLCREINTYMDTHYNINVIQIQDVLVNSHIRKTIEDMIEFSKYSGNIELEEAKPYNVADFKRDTSTIFSEALRLIFMKSLYPNMIEQAEELNIISQNIDQELLQQADAEIVKNYRRIKSTIVDIEKKYNKANVDVSKFSKQIADFKKSRIYKTAAEWTWDLNLSSRDIAYMADTTNSKNYKTDRNIFLYNLNELDEDIKIKIAWIYYKLYNIISNRIISAVPIDNDRAVTNFVNGDSVLSARSGYIKFKAVSLSFCVEVLLNLGGGNGINGLNIGSSVGDVLNINITNILDDFLREKDYDITRLITDKFVVTEDNNYNLAITKGSTLSEQVEIQQNADLITVSDSQPITGGAGEHITGGAFETSVKQVTYPLMTLILNASGNYYSCTHFLSTMYSTMYSSIPSSIARRENTWTSPSPFRFTYTNPKNQSTHFFQSPIRFNDYENSWRLSFQLPYRSIGSTDVDEISDIGLDNGPQPFIPAQTFAPAQRGRSPVQVTDSLNNFITYYGILTRKERRDTMQQNTRRRENEYAEKREQERRINETAKEENQKARERHEAAKAAKTAKAAQPRRAAAAQPRRAAAAPLLDSEESDEEEEALLAATEVEQSGIRQRKSAAAQPAQAQLNNGRPKRGDQSRNFFMHDKKFMGGSKESLKKLYESLPPLPEDTPLADFDESFDVFSDNTICFHPLLPTYMLTQTYMSSVNNENIEESLDFDIFVNYLKFLKKIKENVVQIYSGENNNNENKMEAYAIGLGLKQLLFVSNNNNEGYQNCLEVLGTNNEIYSKASSLTENLVFAVSGKVTYSETDLHLGNIFLNSDLFKSFARNLEVDKIFGFYADSTNFNLSQFRAEILDFSSQLANQIISDRTVNQRPLETILSSEISSQDVSVNEESKDGTPEPEQSSIINDPFGYLESQKRKEAAKLKEQELLEAQRALNQSDSVSIINDPFDVDKRKREIEEMKAKGTYINPVVGEETGADAIHRRRSEKSLEARTKKISSPASSSNSSSSNSSRSPIGNPIGGKKTRKHRRHFKNKRTKRRNRRTRRKTTKKNKRARKNNKSRK
jgi:hypothetical protein